MAQHAQAHVRYRDLAASPLSHVSGPLLQAISQRWDADIPMNAELRAEALQSASLLQEFPRRRRDRAGRPHAQLPRHRR
jgi:FMN-dependent NADH-azoreductase